MEGFALRLEEWINQPAVAEAKRYLLDLKKWSESPEKTSLEEIEKDWRFLSDSLKDIESIHEQTRDIPYERIKKKTSTWILNRIIEKDTEHAKNWAVNARKFADRLKELEKEKTESKLAEEVKKSAFDTLSKVSSFDKDNDEVVSQYQERIVEAEKIFKNKPTEITEEAILNTYDKNIKIEETLSNISTKLGNIRTALITLEWVQEFPDLKDYNKLLTEKKAATSRNDLAGIEEALGKLKTQAESWKKNSKRRNRTCFGRDRKDVEK